MGKVIGVISIKGGVGKTTTVSNLGAVLSNQFAKRVCVVDANFSAANLGLHLGIVNPEVSIQEVIAGKKHVTDAIVNHEKGFDVIASSLTPKKIDPLKLKKHINFLRNQYDYILLDSSPSLNEELLGAMMAADELLVVSSPDYPTLSCTIHAVKVAKKRGTKITGLILNKVREKSFELSREEIERATETPVIAMVPDDIKVIESLAFARPTAVHAPLSNAVVEYKKLGGALTGEYFDDPRLTAKVRRFLFKHDDVVEQNRQTLFQENTKYK